MRTFRGLMRVKGVMYDVLHPPKGLYPPRRRKGSTIKMGYRVTHQWELTVDPREVLEFIRSHGKTSMRDIMVQFDIDNLEANELINLLCSKFKIYAKGYSVWLGKRRVPGVFYLARAGKPRRKSLNELQKKNERRRLAREKLRRVSPQAKDQVPKIQMPRKPIGHVRLPNPYGE